MGSTLWWRFRKKVSFFGIWITTVANTVWPAFIETPMNAWFRNDPASAGQVDAIKSSIPARRSAREVAEAVVFLAGASGSYITGQPSSWTVAGASSRRVELPTVWLLRESLA